MSAEILTMLIGFLTIVLTMVTLINQLRTDLKDEIRGTNNRIDKVESRLSDDIKATNARIDATNAKIDTLLVGLFRGYQYPPEAPKKQDEAA